MARSIVALTRAEALRTVRSCLLHTLLTRARVDGGRRWLAHAPHCKRYGRPVVRCSRRFRRDRASVTRWMPRLAASTCRSSCFRSSARRDRSSGAMSCPAQAIETLSGGARAETSSQTSATRCMTSLSCLSLRRSARSRRPWAVPFRSSVVNHFACCPPAEVMSWKWVRAAVSWSRTESSSGPRARRCRRVSQARVREYAVARKASHPGTNLGQSCHQGLEEALTDTSVASRSRSCLPGAVGVPGLADR